jgi:LDH2 family malate/lactate/ureidoglycolate dehydrogenase
MPLGLFLLRGDNIVIFGEMEEENEEKEHLEKQGIKLQKVTVEELQERKKTAQQNLDWDLE